MKWKITLFGLLLCGFFSLFGVSSSYAVSDVTLHIDSSNSSGWFTFCGPYSSNSCYDYNYYYIKFNDFSLNTTSNTVMQDSGTLRTYFSSGVSSSTQYGWNSRCNPFLTSSCLYDLSFLGFSNSYQIEIDKSNDFSNLYSSGWSIDVILSENNPVSSPCPDPDPCPVVPDTPYGDKFDNIEKAIYTCGAILIMIYFFYCIYRMIIKGSGVN